MTENEYLEEGLKEGNRAIQDSVAKSLWSPLIRYAKRVLIDSSLAEDVVQCALIDLFQYAEKKQTKIKIPEYFYGRIRWLSIAENRKFFRRSEVNLSPDQSWGDLGPDTRVLSPIDEVLREEQQMLVLEALKKLRSDKREVVHLRLIEGRTFKGISELTTVPMGTVFTRFISGLKELRRLLGNDLDS